MAVLHGSWLIEEQGGYLFIWGETWRSFTKLGTAETKGVASHPLAMTQTELTSFCRERNQVIGDSHGKSISEKWSTLTLALPTPISKAGEKTYPVYSVKTYGDNSSEVPLQLQQWEVEGLRLEAIEAVKFLRSLPLGSFKATDAYVGADLRFWTHVCQWSVDLLARCKYLPGLYRNLDSTVAAGWQPLLDSAVDAARLETFAREMPSACRAYQLEDNNPGEDDSISSLRAERSNRLSSDSTGKGNPKSAEELLLGFLSSTADAKVREQATLLPLPTLKEPVVQQWLLALSGASNILAAERAAARRLEAVLRAWATPVQEHIVTPVSQELRQKQFRTCFSLQPPEAGEIDWKLEYCLQAVDNPEFLVDAQTIWDNPVERLEYQGREIEQPQETFLKGLGLASRLYSEIEPSLNEQRPKDCRLSFLEAYKFIRDTAERFKNNGLGAVLPASLKQDVGGKLGLKIKADLPESKRAGLKSLLKLKLELALGDRSISKKEFEQLMAQKSPLVEMNGEWMALQPQDVRAAEKLLNTPPEELQMTVEDALRLVQGDNKIIEKLPVVSFEPSGALQELIANLTDNKRISPLAPASFRGQLRPYQARGAGWLAFLERWGLGACLADDMGLGKTIELIAFLLHLQEQEALEKPTLLVCPTSVLGNWEREVHKFGPTLKTVVHHGDKRLKGKVFAKEIQKQDLVITSYALVYRDAKTLSSVSWQGVVLDEAQNIKNPEAKQSQAARQLNAEFRVALTGTPVENRLSELWSILDFLNPEYLGKRSEFQQSFAVPIEKQGDRSKLQLLRSLVQPFILRRLKTDRDIIQDLPEKQEMNVFCESSEEQKQLHEQLAKEYLGEIEAATGIKRRGLILTLILKIKQLCNHPGLFLKENNLENADRSGKLQRLEEMLEEVIAEGDRALVFTQFAEWGKMLKPYLEEKHGWETLLLYGGTRKQEREEMIDRFQNDPSGPRIFILSLKAGGTGLNLTRANHVFHYDRWWNPAVENQATDRVFRIGQKRNVQVHKFICSKTFEEKINEMIESKKELADQTVSAGEEWLTEMDTEQLRSLLLQDRSAVKDEEEE